MTIGQALSYGYQELADKSSSPFLDARVLLGHLLHLDTPQLILQDKRSLSPQEIQSFQERVARRKTGEPVAYITQTKEFMGLDFFVDPRVLIPRPDTESLVEEAIAYCERATQSLRILDLCTGSGAIILSLAHFLGSKNHSFTAADLSPDALEVAQENQRRLSLEGIDWVHSDLFQNLGGPFDLVLTNPPYLSPQETQEALAKGWKEPSMALDGGAKGLDLPKRLLEESVEKISKNGYLMMEAADEQMDELKLHMETLGFQNLAFLKDLAGHRRVITGCWKE